MKALRVADAGGGLQVSQLLERLDALGDHGHSQRKADRLDRLQDALAARTLMDVRDERPIDLDLVGRDVGQDGQGRIARPEIIDRHANADIAQHRQNLSLKLVLGDERVLRHLDDEAVGALARLQGLDERTHEIQVAGLLGGDVDRNRLPGPEGLVEQVERPDRFVQHEVRDRVDQSELGCKGDEGSRRLNFNFFVLPADQRFEPHHLLAANVDLGLEGAAELAVADGEPQALLQLHARGDALAHLDVEKRRGTFRAALGPVHRAVCVSPQCLVVAAVLGILAHADRRRREYLEAFDVERLLQLFQQALDEVLDVLVAFDRVDQQDELVAADAREHVGLANERGDALRDLDEQRVADGVTVVVVDVLEIVEIDECQRKALAVALGSQDVPDVLLDHGAVGEAGQVIGIGPAREIGFELFAFRNVERRDSSSVSSSTRTGLRDVNHVRSPAVPVPLSSTVLGASTLRRAGLRVGNDRRRVQPGRGNVIDQDETAELVLHGQADRKQIEDALQEIIAALRVARAVVQPVHQAPQLLQLCPDKFGVALGARERVRYG